MRHMVCFCVFLVFWGTLKCPVLFSGLFILRKNLTQYILKLNTMIFDYMIHFIKLNLQINKKMIKMSKRRYFVVSFRYSMVSWGVLGCPGVIRLTLM